MKVRASAHQLRWDPEATKLEGTPQDHLTHPVEAVEPDHTW